MTEEDGKLYGLGTDDMKGGLASAILALQTVIESGYQPRGNIIIQSVVDEEGGGNGSLSCIVERGCNADGVIIAEGTNMEVFPVNRGLLARGNTGGWQADSCKSERIWGKRH